MVAYRINYQIDGKDYEINIDARDLKSAKKKIGRKHGYKSGRKVKITQHFYIGFSKEDR